MRRALVFLLPVLGAVLGGGPVALAAAEECAPMSVEANDALLASAPELPGQVEDRFAAQPALDPCARVRLEQGENAIAVEVALTDGRVASRTVPSAADVIPVLEALLLIPEGEHAKDDASPVSAASAADTLPSSTLTRDDSAPSEERSKMGIELGALGDVHAGDLPTGAGVGLRSTLELWGWLLAADLRARASSAETRVELTGLLGHRFSLRPVELDLFAGLTGDLPGPNESTTGPAPVESLPRPDGEPWFTFGSHVRFTPRDILRPFVGVEATVGVVGPEDANRDFLIDSSVWMGGVVVGAAVGPR